MCRKVGTPCFGDIGVIRLWLKCWCKSHLGVLRIHSHSLYASQQILNTIPDLCRADAEREKHILILAGQNDAHKWSLPGTIRVGNLSVSTEESRVWVLGQMKRPEDFVSKLPHTMLHWAVPFDDNPDHFIETYISLSKTIIN